MVQAALPLVIGAAGTAAGGVGKAFSQQSRPSRRTHERKDTSTAAIAVSKDAKVAQVAMENASQERWLHFLTQPEILALAVLIAGLYASNKITFSKDNTAQNELLQSLCMMGTVLISLGYAGVGDLTTLSVATTAGVGNLVTSFDLKGAWENVGGGVADFVNAINPVNNLVALWNAVT